MEPSSFERGASIEGRYRIVRLLGKGAMGAVYEAFDDRLKVRRAVKLMLPELVFDDDLRARFEREAQVLASIDHPNVLRFHDAGVFEGMPYLVMELLEGETLEARLARRGVFSASEAIELLRPVASALDRLAAFAIVHRDVKPENLFLARSLHGPEDIKLLDFGASKLTVAPRKTHTLALGTPFYMAPEQFLGEGSIGPAADRYALAHVVFTLLTGEPYWTEETRVPNMVQFMASVLRGPVQAPSLRAAKRRRPTQLPLAFDAWFLRATAADPRARFESATAMLDGLGHADAAPAPPRVGTSPIGEGTRAPRARASDKLLPIALVAGSMVFGLALTLFAYRLVARRASSPTRSSSSTKTNRTPPAKDEVAEACTPNCRCKTARADWSHSGLEVLRADAQPLVEDVKILKLETVWIGWNTAEPGSEGSKNIVTFTFLDGAPPVGEFLTMKLRSVTFQEQLMIACDLVQARISAGEPPFPPRCDPARALDAFRAAGHTVKDTKVNYGNSFATHRPEWQFMVPRGLVIVDEGCAVTTNY